MIELVTLQVNLSHQRVKQPGPDEPVFAVPRRTTMNANPMFHFLPVSTDSESVFDQKHGPVAFPFLATRC